MALCVDKEIDWLTSTILPEILKNGRLVDNYSEALLPSFKVGDITIAVIGPEEAFMLTQCYRATIQFEYAGEKYQRKMVVKKTPEIPAEAYNDAQFENLFHNEICFYTDILPIIQKLSDTKFAAPTYYYGEIKAESAVIILGDFASDGWSVTKARYGLSLEHARIAVKYLGRFHGFGYALKHNQPERFKELSGCFRESRFANDNISPEWDLISKVGLQRAAQSTHKYHPEVDKEFIKKFQQLVYKSVGYGRQRVAPREPLSTLCHGDYLRNNVAYKYDTDSSGTPLDIMMFDYQTMRLSSPMVDLSVFLANSVLADVRYSNFDTIFDDYCEALFESYTKQSNEQLPAFLNRETLLQEYIRFLPYSLGISASFLPWLVAPPQLTTAEMFTQQQSQAEIVEASMTQGGEIVDREIAHQMKEMFELSQLHNVQIDEDIDNSEWITSVNFAYVDNNSRELCHCE